MAKMNETAAAVQEQTTIKEQDALKHFEACATVAQTSQMSLIVAGTIALLSAVYLSPKEANRSRKPDDVIDALDKACRDKGLSRSSQYRYIALSKQLGLKLWTNRGTFAEAIAIICREKTAKSAGDHLTAWLKTSHKVGSLDGLELFLTGKNRYEIKPEADKTSDAAGNEKTLRKPKTAKALATAVSQVEKSDDVATAVIASKDKFPLEDVMEKLIPAVDTVDACDALIEALTNRRNQLAAILSANASKRNLAAQQPANAKAA